MVSADSVFCRPAAGGALIPCQEVEESIEPSVAGCQRPGDLVADGDSLHDVAATELPSPQKQEQCPGYVEGQETERKQQCDGYNGFNGFPSPPDIVRVL